MRRLALTPLRPVLVGWLWASTGCFDPGPATRGLPCTENSGCGELSCEYGVCGGPVRCEAGAGVGDYCFTFEARELDVGTGIDALAVGTIDLDALPDIVVGNGDAQTLALLRNLGAGEFAGAVHSQSLGLAIDELAIGAVDGAGWADVVATSGGTTLATIPILPGAGSTGEIGTPVIVATGLVDAARPQIGEFVDNGDALPDVAALVATGFDVFPQTAPATYAAGVHTEVAGSVDLQKVGFDANPVFVASSTGNSVVAHKRISGGAFAPTTTIDVGPNPSVFVVDDLDNDTFGDVLSVSASGEMWLTTGRDTTFVMPRDPIAVYDLGWPATTLLAHNLDEDPEPELIVSGTTPGGRRDVYLFDNDGQGRPVYGGSLGIDDASSVVAADLDLDGVAEIIVLSQTTGKVRVARRAVAPPPPGGDDTTTDATTGIDPTVDPSSPSDPSLTTTPMTTDPSGMTDPTLGEDTGVVPSCPEASIPLGSSCYANFGLFGVSARVQDIVVDRLGNVEPTLIVLTEDGLVWTYPGSLFGTFDPTLGEFPFGVTGIPSGLAVGSIDLPIDPKGDPVATAVIVVTHDLGFSVFAPGTMLQFPDWPIGPSVAPVVGRLLNRDGVVPASGIAVGTTADTLLRVLHPSMLLTGEPPFESAVVAPVTDIDVVFTDALNAGLVVASGGPPEIYVATESADPFNFGAAVEGTSSVYTKSFSGFDSGFLATASPTTFEVYQSVDDALLLVYIEEVLVVSDIAAGNVDGAPGDELLALIDYGDGVRYVRVWTATDGFYYPLADLYLENLSAFAVTDVFGAGNSDLLLAATDELGNSGVLHLGLVQ
jgi:hypothetical protein